MKANATSVATSLALLIVAALLAWRCGSVGPFLMSGNVVVENGCAKLVQYPRDLAVACVLTAMLAGAGGGSWHQQRRIPTSGARWTKLQLVAVSASLCIAVVVEGWIGANVVAFLPMCGEEVFVLKKLPNAHRAPGEPGP